MLRFLRLWSISRYFYYKHVNNDIVNSGDPRKDNDSNNSFIPGKCIVPIGEFLADFNRGSSYEKYYCDILKHFNVFQIANVLKLYLCDKLYLGGR